MRGRRGAAIVACMTTLGPSALHAQAAGDTLLRPANPAYVAGPLPRVLAGHGWRELWAEPLRVPVLDVRRFAGGLTPVRRGGGNQSLTLHFSDPTGRAWIFRSIDKFPTRALGQEFAGSPLGAIVQDQIGSLHPGAHFLLPPLLAALDILHVEPRLYIMPDDDEALGEYHAQFAGMLGSLEQRANEGPAGSAGFAGSRAVKGTDEFLEDLEADPAHRVDAHEFLRARLLDFVIGDPDRGTDQWRWARFDEEHGYVWRPIPIDRDWAFVNADGRLLQLVRRHYPKLTRFTAAVPPLDALTFSTHVLDRRLLTALSRADFQQQAAKVQAALSNDVIARAVAAMPPEYVRIAGDTIAAVLRKRRDRLHAAADAWYGLLATEVDVRGTDAGDRARIERLVDGSVIVELPPHYRRRFLPGETREVRVHLHGGADEAAVVGATGGPITVRIIGGGGDDVLEDRVGRARLYDDRGDNRFVGTRGTSIDRRRWSEPEAPEGIRLGSAWAPDWGAASWLNAAFGYDTGTGVNVGGQWVMRRYGFRSLPHRWQATLRARVAPLDGAAGIDATFDHRLPNSRHALTFDAEATQLETFRFYGFGNASASAPSRQRTVRTTRLAFEPALRFERARVASIRIGPAAAWTRTQATRAVEDPAIVAATGADIAQLGGQAELALEDVDRPASPRRGYHLRTRLAGFPIVSEPAGAFARASVEARAWLPLLAAGPHLALRAGGERVFGDFPLHDAAFLGGARTLRGMASERLAGDAAAYGSVELRVPVDTLTLLLPTELGTFAFGDVGRVWHAGASPGGFHTGFGGGIWLGAFDYAVSAAVARGRDGVHAYFRFGMPF